MSDDFTLPLTEPFPWASAQHSYAGWIPNVSGHLSFGLICPKGAPHSINHRSEPSGERTVVVHTRRSAQDFPFPGRFVGAVRPSVTQDYVLIGRTTRTATPFFNSGGLQDREEDHGALTGLILIVPHNSNKEAKRKRKAFLADIDNAIEDALAEVSSSMGMGPAHAEHLPDLMRAQANAARDEILCYIARFAMFRTGEFRLWFDDDLFFGRDTVAVPPTPNEREAADIIPAQMYFFAKDTTHQHYHHDPETDQILKLFRVNTMPLTLNDETWRIDTLRGLAKVVVEHRHSNHSSSNKKALGILAYADAFQSLLARVKRGSGGSARFADLHTVIPYDFAHVRSSIEALDAQNETLRGALLQFFGIIVGVVLSAFALWSNAVQIQGPLCDVMKDGPTPCPKMEPNTALDVVNWVVANPLGFVVALTVFGFIAFEITFRSLSSLRWVRQFKRWVNRFGSAAGATISRYTRDSDSLGYVGWLAILAGLTIASGYAAYWIVPKHEVPVVGDQKTTHKGGGWQLDPLVGKKPAESGLFTGSVISHDLRDLAGDDYGDFLALMANAPALQRSGVLWVAGVAAGSNGRDGAYIIIDQDNRKLEIGLRRGGATLVHRSPGPVISKPPEISKAFDGLTGDIMPVAIQAPQCGSSMGNAGHTLIFQGTLPAVQPCEYRIPMRAGQVLSYSATSAHGLQLLVAEEGHKVKLIDARFTAPKDGTYIVDVLWEKIGKGPAAPMRLRSFYLNTHID